MTITRADITLSILGADDFPDLLPIYTEALAPEERKADSIIQQSLSRPDYITLGARAADGQLLGFASSYRSASYPFAMLEYLATDHAARGQGIGAKLVEATLAALPNLPLLIEVDAIAENDAPDAMTRRRQIFYRRTGCLKIEGIPYRMPQVAEGIPPLMDIFLHPNGPTQPLTAATLRLWLIDIYHHVYNRPEAAAEIDAFIGAPQSPLLIA